MSIKKEDRVVVPFEDGYEFGTVKWIGPKPDQESIILVGVIFDHEVGHCDGTFKEGRKFFSGPPRRCSYLPVDMVQKAADYLGYPQFDLGAAVMFMKGDGSTAYGAVKWIGRIKGDAKHEIFAGLEMELESDEYGDGTTVCKNRYFVTKKGFGTYVQLEKLKKDNRIDYLQEKEADIRAMSAGVNVYPLKDTPQKNKQALYKHETEETKGLTTAELQRLVLIEQLQAARAQKEAAIAQKTFYRGNFQTVKPVTK